MAGHYLFLLVALSALLSATAYGGRQLSEQYYSRKCPSLNEIVETEVRSALVTHGRQIGASLLRLFFHDCFVQGCDASVLLDEDPTVSEKNARPNLNSLQGFDVIDGIKVKVEEQCHGVVSCADIVALAAKQAIIALGGPSNWTLLLGRRDSMTANKAQAESDLPSPSSDLTTLIKAFGKKGFTTGEMVALSGAHTIGLAKCTNADGTNCIDANSNNVLLLPLDKRTPDKFDNRYYENLSKDGLLHSDRVLVDSDYTKSLVGQYASNQTRFFQDFVNAMQKMSEMSVLTGTNGQIRSDCHCVNK